MRVLHIISSVNPDHGGPSEAVRTEVIEFDRMGHESEVLTLDSPTAAFILTFPAPVHAVGPGVGLGRFRYSRRFAQWIEANARRFDVVVIHGLWGHASVGAWRALRRAALPYVLFTHGMMDPWFRRHYPFKHVAKQAFWWLLQGRVLRDAEAVLFTCEEERLLARGAFHGPRYNERVVAYGAPDPQPPHPIDVEEFHKRVPRLGGRPFLLFMSRIHPKKGCDLLIGAFARIAPDFPEVDLVIAGPDQIGQQAELEQLARASGVADRIHWPGMLTGHAKSGALRAAQAMILPSHQENFGIVVAEALSCGRPVLISNRVNIWREVAEADAGIVVDDTVSGTETLLRKFLSLPDEERERMGHAAQRLYNDRFTTRAAAEDLASVLLACVARSPAHPK